MTATAVGLDFSCASRVVFAEVPATPDVLQQAEARAHRPKTPFPVNSYVLLCQRTADVRVWVRLTESLERTSSLIEAKYTGVCRRANVLDGACLLSTARVNAGTSVPRCWLDFATL